MATMSTKVGICDIGAKQHRAGLYQDDLLRCPRQTIWRVSERREPEQEQACLPKPWSRSLRPVCGFLVTHWASVSTCASSKKRRVWRRRQPFELSSCLPIWWGGDPTEVKECVLTHSGLSFSYGLNVFQVRGVETELLLRGCEVRDTF